MTRRAGRRGMRGARAVVARLLAIALLLASLVAPHLAEAACPEPSRAASPATLMVVDQDGAPGPTSRPHGVLHAGLHCACHLADRLAPAAWVGPSAQPMAVQPALAAEARASHQAEPPARPPRD